MQADELRKQVISCSESWECYSGGDEGGKAVRSEHCWQGQNERSWWTGYSKEVWRASPRLLAVQPMVMSVTKTGNSGKDHVCCGWRVWWVCLLSFEVRPNTLRGPCKCWYGARRRSEHRENSESFYTEGNCSCGRRRVSSGVKRRVQAQALRHLPPAPHHSVAEWRRLTRGSPGNSGRGQ